MAKSKKSNEKNEFSSNNNEKSTNSKTKKTKNVNLPESPSFIENEKLPKKNKKCMYINYNLFK